MPENQDLRFDSNACQFQSLWLVGGAYAKTWVFPDLQICSLLINSMGLRGYTWLAVWCAKINVAGLKI